MSDRFYKDIELPNISENITPPAPPSDFIQLYGKNGKLVVHDSLNVETVIEPTVVTKLIVDGGSPATVPQNFVLRFDFGGVT